jgi:hypothetical protein
MNHAIANRRIAKISNASKAVNSVSKARRTAPGKISNAKANPAKAKAIATAVPNKPETTFMRKERRRRPPLLFSTPPRLRRPSPSETA